jgi:hypothetical protein
MMDVKQVRSWHIIKETWDDERAGQLIVKMRCGLERMWDGTSEDVRPAGKSCETCLRWLTKNM